MNNTMRNLTLSAAALAALMSIAPKAEAQQDRGHGAEASRTQAQGRGTQRREERGFGGTGRRESPRQEFREERRERGSRNYGNRGGSYGNRGHYGAYGYRGYGANRGYRNYGHAYISPGRSYVRGGYAGYASPFRVFSGFRFYNACPGAGYVYIADLGWAQPPYYGAEWVPGYYDEEGFQVEGFWR